VSFKRNISINLVIQAIGPVLLFFITFLIAKIGGAEIQGYYAVVTAWINIFVVIGLFGFPQSFIFLINKLNISHRILFKMSLYYTLFFFIFLMLITFIIFKLNMINEIIINSLRQIVVLGIPITILVFHGLLRSIYLTYNQGMLFAIFSILPGSLLFLFIFIGIVFNDFNFQLIYLLSSIPVLIIDIVLFKPVLRNSKKQEIIDFPWKPLFEHGTQTFLQAVFFSLQPIIAYWFINKYIGSVLEIGYFNLGLFLVQGLLVPISMVAPLLFDYWTKNNDQMFILKFTKTKIFILELLIGGIMAFVLNYFIPVVFGSEYESSIEIAQILIFIIPVVIHTRVLMPFIHSKGYPILNTYSGLIRFIVFLILSYLWMINVSQELVGLAVCWSIAELIGALLTINFFIHINKKEKTYAR
jgi:O-antigen/teichoic acid export membrane protein